MKKHGLLISQAFLCGSLLCNIVYGQLAVHNIQKQIDELERKMATVFVAEPFNDPRYSYKAVSDFYSKIDAEFEKIKRQNEDKSNQGQTSTGKE